MPGPGQRLWRASSPLGWISELGLVGAGPVAILAGFALAAVVDLARLPGRSWALDASLVFFALAVTVLVVALRLIIAAQSHLSAPADYLSWRPEAARSPAALAEERDRQVADYNIYMYYRGMATRVFPAGVASALLGLAAACLDAVPGHGSAGSLAAAWIAAAVLAVGAVISALEVWERPARLFPADDEALARIARRLEQRQRQRQRGQAAPRQAAAGGLAATSALPEVLRLLPLDLPGFAAALGDDLITPPLLTPGARTIRDLAECLPTESQRAIFRLACRHLAAEFGGYSTTRTSVLFTVISPDRVRERVIAAIHPVWSELEETGVPFEASPELIAARGGQPLAEVMTALSEFAGLEQRWTSADCLLLRSEPDVDRLTRLLATRAAQI